MGVIYAKRGDLEKAEQMYKKALEIDEKLGRREGIAIRYKNLGLIQQTRGDLSEARVYMKKALEIFRNIGIKPEIEKVQRFIDELDEQVKGKD